MFFSVSIDVFVGVALFIGKRERGMVQPVQLRAPEVILGYPWAEPIDIWAIGCLVSLNDFTLTLCLYLANHTSDTTGIRIPHRRRPFPTIRNRHHLN